MKKKNLLIGVPGHKKRIDLNDIPQFMFNVKTIMKTLDNINRFNGRGIYQVTVLQHSWYVSQIVKMIGCNDYFIMGGLCHDFSEAFVGDMIRPVKDMCPDFALVEREVQHQIGANMPSGAIFSSEVREADMIALRFEAAYCGFDVTYWDLPPLRWKSDKSIQMLESLLTNALGQNVESCLDLYNSLVK